MFITVCWLTHRLMLSFLAQPRTFPRNDAAHSGLRLPKAISNQPFSQTCPQASLIVIIPHWRLPSQATPGCVKLTILITSILTGQPFNYYDVFYMSIIKPITQHQLFVLKSCVSPSSAHHCVRHRFCSLVCWWTSLAFLLVSTFSVFLLFSFICKPAYFGFHLQGHSC